jgi:D-alanine-D-alanine ligase
MRDRLYTQTWKTDPSALGYQQIEVICPAPIDRPDWRARLESVAVDAYRALGLRDYARFDLRMLDDEPQILDVNVNPDLMNDERSVFVLAAEARGIEYARMVRTIIELASARMPHS